ncbi:MAG: GTP cyclohydrolase MptA [Methanomassiliicoccales archaeon PtaU1.Bin124]|nr:MAG: GTP cyclohydrolase MptA [Methanomassiliicoccales archaeon PtaU1.Bin124]
MSLTDVQNRRLSNGFMLSRVGVTGVKKPVQVCRGGKTVTLFCVIDVFVDLPSSQKGSHLSRNLEVISDVVENSLSHPVKGLEELAATMGKDLLERHEYASFSEVLITADYFMERTVPSGRRTMESYKLLARAVAKRGNGMKKMIGVEVIGMTACPCAMETVADLKYGNLRDKTKDGPNITHNQRNVTTVMMEVPEDYDVEANDLIDIVESSFSSPTFEILKRAEEAQVVIVAHDNPKFVEDVVRANLTKILEKFKHLPDDTVVTVRSESQESIHKHNAFAERVTTLGEIRTAE